MCWNNCNKENKIFILLYYSLNYKTKPYFFCVSGNLFILFLVRTVLYKFENYTINANPTNFQYLKIIFRKDKIHVLQLIIIHVILTLKIPSNTIQFVPPENLSKIKLAITVLR